MLALGISRFAPYSILHQRYRQTDHANKTWVDLRLDIELIITNNITGTSRDPIFRTRERTRWDQPPAENRASRIFYDAYHDAPSHQLNYNGKRYQDPNQKYTLAPTAELTTAQPSARTPSAISARLPSPAQPLARHTTWPITSMNQSGPVSDQLRLVTTTDHPHHLSSPAPQRI
jgi:hypothetical protein